MGRKTKYIDDPGGAGYEIAKEVLACAQCAREYETMQASRTAMDEPVVERPLAVLADIDS